MNATSAELRAFDATARLGSMSQAARQLGLTQPTVSAHVVSLERQFGVELFFRRGRSVSLTEFGQSLLDITQRMFGAEHEALALLHEARSQYKGRLHLCAVGPYNLMPILKRYRERWPGVQISVSVGDSRDIVQRVLAYQGDLAMPLNAVDDARLFCLPYRRQRLVVFAQRAHVLAGRGTVRLEDLAGHEFVMREDGSTTRRVFEQGLRAAGVVVRVALEVGSREAVREAVAQGLGLGVVADAAYVPDPRLQPLQIAGAGLYTHPHIVGLKERREARLIAHFLAVADELRAALPPEARVPGP